MDIIDILFGRPLSWVMWGCLQVVQNYGAALILFTFLTRLVLFPMSIWVQKNSIKMIKIKPEINRLDAKYIYNRDKFHEEQLKVFKREKYNVFAGFLPMLIQIPLIMGIISVINNPIDEIKDFDMGFFGLQLSEIPEFLSLSPLWIMPILAGLSAFAMCMIQNKINVLQIEQGFWGQWGMTVFLTVFSLYFGFVVAGGVALFWICSNVFAIGQMYLLNALYNPKKHIDYDALAESKQLLADVKKGAVKKKFVLFDRSPEHKREVADYKRFFRVPAHDMKLVFYSEASGFYKYFQGIIEVILAQSDLKIHYITSDPADAVFQMKQPNLIPYYIGESKLISLMMKLTADMVVMTMPDLQQFHIKRSYVRKDIEYVFTDHGGTSVNMLYRPGALDHYDTFFAASEAQALEVRAMEKLRNTKRKNILKLGNPVLDSMIASYEAHQKSIDVSSSATESNGIKSILIAPSWSEDNILDSCLDGILSQILNKGFKVTVRPHPQYIRRFPDRMQQIMDRYSSQFNECFAIETDFSSNVTVYTADLVITDWSAIGAEFSFTTLKPTLYINTKMKVVNPDYEKIDIVPCDITFRDIIGVTVEKSDMDNAYHVICDVFNRQEEFQETIRKTRDAFFYNIRRSGDVGAKYIIQRLCSF